MKTLKAALLGGSLVHSISPEVHRALFETVRAKAKTDFDALDYSMIECKNEIEFLSCIRDGKTNGFSGFNITFPFKYAAATIDGEILPLVKQILSANTILCQFPLKITSTDGNGFCFALEKSCPDLFYKDYALTILGAGGAARAVLHAIHLLGWKRMTVAARNKKLVQRAVRSYKSVAASSLEKISWDTVPQFIVQATPVGQRTGESLLENFEWRNGDIAVDLVYNPQRTRFLDLAANSGTKIVDGLGMLIEQAALSQYFWMTGEEADHSLLTQEEFQIVHNTLSKFLTPRWEHFAI